MLHAGGGEHHGAPFQQLRMPGDMAASKEPVAVMQHQRAQLPPHQDPMMAGFHPGSMHARAMGPRMPSRMPFDVPFDRMPMHGVGPMGGTRMPPQQQMMRPWPPGMHAQQQQSGGPHGMGMQQHARHPYYIPGSFQSTMQPPPDHLQQTSHQMGQMMAQSSHMFRGGPPFLGGGASAVHQGVSHPLGDSFMSTLQQPGGGHLGSGVYMESDGGGSQQQKLPDFSDKSDDQFEDLLGESAYNHQSNLCTLLTHS